MKISSVNIKYQKWNLFESGIGSTPEKRGMGVKCTVPGVSLTSLTWCRVQGKNSPILEVGGMIRVSSIGDGCLRIRHF